MPTERKLEELDAANEASIPDRSPQGDGGSNHMETVAKIAS